MKGFILCTVFLLVSSIYFGIHYKIGSNVVETDKVFRVGVECDYPPNNWEAPHATDFNVPLINKEGSYADGYDIQIAKIVSKALGAKLEVKKIAWEDLIPALNNNEIDAIFSGMLDTKARKELINFTDTYEDRETVYAILVRRNDKWSNAKNLEDFEGARFVGQVDSNLDTAIDHLTGAIHLPPVASPNEMLEALLNRQADGIISDFEIVQNYVKTYPELKFITFPQDKMYVFEYTGICAGVRKTDEKLLQDINGVLKNISMEDRHKIMDGAIARNSN